VLLAELLSPERIAVPLRSRTKEDVIQELAELAARGRGAAVAESIAAAVRQREAELSTGIGDGVAVPHGRTPAVDDLVLVAGVSQVPIDYDAIDGKPVQLFFLLVSPESASSKHVRALSRLSRLLRRRALRDELRATSSSEAFLRLVLASEAA
jgi:mannitol/fructose-specific phosphotransferase system IIA component (Ntr-type)